jgi:hypothetical protein
VRRARRPAASALPLLAVLAIFPNLQLPADWVSRVEHVTGLATIAATAWGIVALIMLGADYAKGYHTTTQTDEDNLRLRQIETRVDILSRVAVTVIVLIATATCLMTFPAVRAIGATLLASAGLAG